MSVTRMMMQKSLQYVDLLDPQPDQIHLDDIAWNLSMLARYNGGISRFLSVAEHSIVCLDVARYVYGAISPRVLLAVLLHDAHEYLIGDMVGPVKNLPEMREPMAILTERYNRVIEQKFNVSFNHVLIDVVDKRVASREMELFSRLGEPQFQSRYPSVTCDFYNHSQEQAYHAFKQRALILMDQIESVPA